MCNQEISLTFESVRQIENTVDNTNFTQLLTNLYRNLWVEDATFGHGLGSFLNDSELGVIETIVDETESNTPTLSQYLNELMHKKAMTQSEVSKYSGLSYNYVNNLVNGVSNGSKYRLVAIAIGMELSLKETTRLLDTCGYKLNDSLKDRIIIACIQSNIRNIGKVEDALNRVQNANLSLLEK